VGYVHAKSPVAQRLASSLNNQTATKLTRITDNSLYNCIALASLFSSKAMFSTSSRHQTSTVSTATRFPESPPGRGKQLTVPEALSCSKEFDMIAIADWVSQSAVLWWWKLSFYVVAGEEEILLLRLNRRRSI
jgi:hypothetical protein